MTSVSVTNAYIKAYGDFKKFQISKDYSDGLKADDSLQALWNKLKEESK